MASKLLITPWNGSTTAGQDPTIKFQGTGNSTDITLRTTSTGSLSFEGAAGQLLSITDSLSGSIFAVSDVSGIPSIEVLDTGLVKINEFNGGLQIGSAANLANQVTIKGTTDTSSLTTGSMIVDGGVAIAKGLNVGGVLSASRSSVGTGYFGLGTTLSSSAATNDTSLRWDGTGGKLLFSYGSAIVGSITSAGALSVNSTITSATTVSSPQFAATATAASGYALWNSSPATYGILMATAADATYGGRISGESTSDYNMYLTMVMAGGTNRGFVFRNAYATPLLAINGDGVRSNVSLSVTGSITATTSIVIGSNGPYVPGCIYSDTSWGMIFRAKQASPGTAEYLWTNSGGTELMRIGTTGELSVVGQVKLKEVKDTVFTITDAAAFEIDPVNGSIQKVTLGASRSPLATNFESGQTVLLKIADGTDYTVTWPSVVWVGGSAPTLSTTGYSLVLLWKDGDALYGKYIGDVA